MTEMIEPAVDYPFTTDPKRILGILEECQLTPSQELASSGLGRFSLNVLKEEGRVSSCYNDILAIGDTVDVIPANLPPDVVKLIKQTKALYRDLPDWMRDTRKNAQERKDYHSRGYDSLSGAEALSSWCGALLSPEEIESWLEELLADDSSLARNPQAFDVGLIRRLDPEKQTTFLYRFAESENEEVARSAFSLLRLTDPTFVSKRVAEVSRESISRGVVGLYTYRELREFLSGTDKADIHSEIIEALRDTPLTEGFSLILYYIIKDFSPALVEQLEEIIDASLGWFLESEPESQQSMPSVDLIRFASPMMQVRVVEAILGKEGDSDRLTCNPQSSVVRDVCYAMDSISSMTAERLFELIIQQKGYDWSTPKYIALNYVLPGLTAEYQSSKVLQWINEGALPDLFSYNDIVQAELKLNNEVNSLLRERARREALGRYDNDEPDVGAMLDSLGYIGLAGEDQKMKDLIKKRALDDRELRYVGYDLASIVSIVQTLPREEQKEWYTALVSKFREIPLASSGAYSLEYLMNRFDEQMPRGTVLGVLRDLKLPGSGTLLQTSNLANELSLQQTIYNVKSDGELYMAPEEKIVRVVSFVALDAWLKSLLDDRAWADFGYVPIEPILAVDKADDKTMNVAVLTIELRGESMRQALFKYDTNIIADIIERVDLIRGRLENVVGVRHNHHHYGNFVLVPQKTNNQLDPSKLPRIYMIDFDMAIAKDVVEICDISENQQTRFVDWAVGA